METFDIWGLEGVFIQISDVFFDKINQKIFSKFRNKPNAYRNIFQDRKYSYSFFKNTLKSSYSKKWFLPLDFLTEICSHLGIDRSELQNSIIAYKSWGSINFIENPKLPILISPVFDMLYAHNIGDGTVSVAKNRMPYFAYRQFNQFYREAYIKKIEYIFGKIRYRKQKFLDFTRVRCPSALSSLFFKYYNLDDRGFLSETARLSPKIYQKGKDSMLAVLFAFIIDEGFIDSTQINIVLKNKKLVEDLDGICKRLDYKSIIIEKKGDYEGYSGLYIKKEGMTKLYQDYLELNKKYSVIDLGIKGEKIAKSFKYKERPIYKTKGNKSLIFRMLKKGNLTVNQIGEILMMTRQGVRWHIHNLLNENKIKIVDQSKQNWVYGV